MAWFACVVGGLFTLVGAYLLFTAPSATSVFGLTFFCLIFWIALRETRNGGSRFEIGSEGITRREGKQPPHHIAWNEFHSAATVTILGREYAVLRLFEADGMPAPLPHVDGEGAEAEIIWDGNEMIAVFGISPRKLADQVNDYRQRKINLPPLREI